MKNFEPEIIVFSCEWIPYIGADNAGAERIQYPTNIKIVRVNCTGRITPSFILEAFRNGVQGVLVAGCQLGECHYISGNETCRQVVAEAKELLKISGIKEDRLEMELFSSMDGTHFASTMKKFTQKIKTLG